MPNSSVTIFFDIIQQKIVSFKPETTFSADKKDASWRLKIGNVFSKAKCSGD
jgi:hypothetical protein